MILDLALAFAAGLLSFASTCVLPLVPAYVTYMGAAAAGTETTVRQQVKVLGNGEAGAAWRVSAHAFSATAREKITAAGGTVTQL